jgi:hypothetical protein
MTSNEILIVDVIPDSVDKLQKDFTILDVIAGAKLYPVDDLSAVGDS